MANIKQQAKRNLTNEKRRLQNAAFKSSVKTAVKSVEAAVANKNLEEAQEALKLACTKLDKALAKGIYHKNFVSRNKSRLAKLLNSLA
ncbi:MAG: 30S ribosomal protein S20 [Bacilli bacterium]|jgi:small subunit ribosomal protein S20|nr:30S ribosomal protein S20 [Bacilli bacterium]MDD3348775.1 30S ribosomal protein S20 [Bacilli bacterium]MDD4056301.1 30S ribosomal protein S20 [Bacilli bacterium]MDY0209240.1 30S ribosomal protein S20 [Bacilli bacterium]